MREMDCYGRNGVMAFAYESSHIINLIVFKEFLVHFKHCAIIFRCPRSIAESGVIVVEPTADPAGPSDAEPLASGNDSQRCP